MRTTFNFVIVPLAFLLTVSVFRRKVNSQTFPRAYNLKGVREAEEHYRAAERCGFRAGHFSAVRPGGPSSEL